MLGDGGYQGVKKTTLNSRTPRKRWRGRVLTAEQRLENRELAGERVVVENVIRRLKVLKETYCYRRRRFGLRLNLIAGLYNADLQVKS